MWAYECEICLATESDLETLEDVTEAAMEHIAYCFWPFIYEVE